jgi:hypothetical protein
MPNFGKNLIRAAGGSMEPGDTLTRYFWRIAEKTGLGFHLIERGWKDDYVSKNTAEKLRKAENERLKNDDHALIEKFEGWIAAWEKIDPSYFGPDIAAFRDAVDRMRRMADTRRRVALSQGGGDDRKE